MSGDYDPSASNDMLKNLGHERVYFKVAVRNEADNVPYSVTTYSYKKNCSLYFIVSGDNDAIYTVSDIMDSLAYTGIGGKISSGYGKFDYDYNTFDINDLKKRIEKESDRYMSLSVSMVNDDELKAVVEDRSASYELIKRSGFIASYNGEKPLKKRDFYCFKVGSCFGKRFQGKIFDVSPSAYNDHKVYRYAMPMLIGI